MAGHKNTSASPQILLPTEKALGGGSPIGAFGGRIDIKGWANEHRTGEGNYVWMASTLRCNPVLTVAANATLSAFHQPGTYEKLHRFGQYLRDGLTRVLAEHELVTMMIGDGLFAQVVFSANPVFNYRSNQKSKSLMLALFDISVFLNPMGTKLNISIATTVKSVTIFWITSTVLCRLFNRNEYVSAEGWLSPSSMCRWN